MNKFLISLLFFANGTIFACEKSDVKVKRELSTKRASVKKCLDILRKRKASDSDNDSSMQEVSSAEPSDYESDQEDTDQSPAKPQKAISRRKNGEQQYGGGSTIFKCGIEGCATTCRHQRNVWEHWRKIHKLTYYYECPLGCADGRVTHFGSFRRHIRDHSETEKSLIPSKFKASQFPGYPLLSDKLIKAAQEYNQKVSYSYKNAKIKKEEVEHSSARSASNDSSVQFEPLSGVVSTGPADPKITKMAALAASRVHEQSSQNSASAITAVLSSSAAVETAPDYTWLARKILKSFNAHRDALEQHEKEAEEARAQGFGLGAGKSPAHNSTSATQNEDASESEIDQQDVHTAAAQSNDVGKAKLVTDNNPRWQPAPHIALSNAASKVILPPAAAAKEVPLSFEEYCEAQRKARLWAKQLTPEQQRQQKDFNELLIMQAQLALLHR